MAGWWQSMFPEARLPEPCLSTQAVCQFPWGRGWRLFVNPFFFSPLEISVLKSHCREGHLGWVEGFKGLPSDPQSYPLCPPQWTKGPRGRPWLCKRHSWAHLWPPCRFTTMLSTFTNREKFIRSAIGLLRTHGFDGLDLFFLYPGLRGSPRRDRWNFLFLLEVRPAWQLLNPDMILPYLGLWPRRGLRPRARAGEQ